MWKCGVDTPAWNSPWLVTALLEKQPDSLGRTAWGIADKSDRNATGWDARWGALGRPWCMSQGMSHLPSRIYAPVVCARWSHLFCGPAGCWGWSWWARRGILPNFCSVYPVTLPILALYCCFPLSSWATLGNGFKPLCLSLIQLVCEKPRSYRHGKRPGFHF